jgi:hypothetical protein
MRGVDSLENNVCSASGNDCRGGAVAGERESVSVESALTACTQEEITAKRSIRYPIEENSQESERLSIIKYIYGTLGAP